MAVSHLRLGSWVSEVVETIIVAESLGSLVDLLVESWMGRRISEAAR